MRVHVLLAAALLASCGAEPEPGVAEDAERSAERIEVMRNDLSAAMGDAPDVEQRRALDDLDAIRRNQENIAAMARELETERAGRPDGRR